MGTTKLHRLEENCAGAYVELSTADLRDIEQAAAQIAVQASLTGHLVLATLHTNDAVSAVTRLTDMGVEPFLLASSMLGVLAQRLVRRLCQQCRTPDESVPGNWRPLGCPRCLLAGDEDSLAANAADGRSR